jgi:hypothetical protein
MISKMRNKRGDLAGFSAIEDKYKLLPVQELSSCCRIGTKRATVINDNYRVETFLEAYAPEDTLRGHFEFGLKYDDLNLEWLSRLFSKLEHSWIVDWLNDTPTSLYARKTAFFYEWLSEKRLPVENTKVTGYESALDDSKYLTNLQGKRNQRWKIVDNLPGTPAYCPLVRLTPELKDAANFDLQKELNCLDEKYGADLLMRSAAWLTFNESRATFTIEREADRTDDIKRFAATMAIHCGRIKDPLSDASLQTLQQDVLGARALRRGIRKSPVFVGTSARHDVTIVRYIAPHFSQIQAMLDGLRTFEKQTRYGSGQVDPLRTIVRAGVIAYGFVYIHPLSDGNGRVHRLLVNDTLMRDGLVPIGIILPISSTIVKSSTMRGDYERVLDRFSAKQIHRYSTSYSFGKEVACEDGVITDFKFNDYEDAAHAWRFPDLTAHAHFMAKVIRSTVITNMTQEAEFLAKHDDAKQRLKKVFELPDRDADAIIRSLRQNNGRATNILTKRYEAMFEDPLIAAGVLEAVMSALEGRPMEDVDGQQDNEINRISTSTTSRL